MDEGPTADPPEAALSTEVADAVRRGVADSSGCTAGEVEVVAVDRLSGGASRLTWRVTARAAGVGPLDVIVQQERPGSPESSLPMSAQASLLRAAGAAGVPVPEVLAEAGGRGSGCVVTSLVEGESVPRRVLRSEALADARATMAADCGRILAALHSIDPASIGPGVDLPRGDPLQQMRALLDGLGEPHPAFELGLRWLSANRPPAGPPVLVHGDFRLGNLLVAPGGVAAVLDWELAHLGSGVEDLGWFCHRAWRFGSPLRAGGVGTAHDLLAGYAEGGGTPPSTADLDWWEAFGCLRWGLICVLQASVHLGGMHRSVELAAIGRRAAEAEEDLLELVAGPSDYEPPEAPEEASAEGNPPHDRPSATELLEAVAEHLDGLRDRLGGSEAFHLRVAGNVVGLLGRELALSPRLAPAHALRLGSLGVQDDAELAAAIRSGSMDDRIGEVTDAVRADVRDKLAVSHPGWWRGDG